MNTLKVFLFVAYVIVVVSVLVLIDMLAFQARYTTHVFYRPQCDYVMPDEWEIVNNGELFAVKKRKSNSFLYEGSHGVREMDIHFSKPTLFFDECKAKAYLKSYLKDREPKMTFK